MIIPAKRILLAEDDAHDVELTLAALDNVGLADQIAVVRDGDEALDYLLCRGKHRGRPGGGPAVFLLDLKMPKVDGFQVLLQVRAEEKLQLMPVVMLTSSREPRDLLTSYRLGANAYVVKPIEFDRLVESLKRLGAFWALVNEPPPSSLDGPAMAPGDQGAPWHPCPQG